MDTLTTNDANLNAMLAELLQDLEGLPCTWETLEQARESIHSIIHQTYNNFLICQPKDNQKNEEFKKFLFTSLENIITASLHKQIYGLVLAQFQKDDEMLYEKCKELAAIKVTADQLGAMEDYTIPLPSAVRKPLQKSTQIIIQFLTGCRTCIIRYPHNSERQIQLPFCYVRFGTR